MLSADFVLAMALLYVALLFAVAFAGDRRARTGRLGWLQSPLVYTLSISIYCTSWTFYGAVGSARARRARVRDDLHRSDAGLRRLVAPVAQDRAHPATARHHVDRRHDLVTLRQERDARAVVTMIARGRHHALHRATAQSRSRRAFDVIDNAGPDPLSARRCRTTVRRLPAGVLDRGRHGGVHHPLRHAQHRRQGASSRRGHGDRASRQSSSWSRSSPSA